MPLARSFAGCRGDCPVGDIMISLALMLWCCGKRITDIMEIVRLERALGNSFCTQRNGLIVSTEASGIPDQAQSQQRKMRRDVVGFMWRCSLV